MPGHKPPTRLPLLPPGVTPPWNPARLETAGYFAPPPAPPPAPRPAPPSGGGGGGGPQIGDIDPSTGLRLSNTGEWLTQNFFSDLTGGGGDGGGGGGGLMPAAPGPGPMPAAPGPMPLTPGAPMVGRQPWMAPGTYQGIEMPDQMYGYIPEALRSQFAQLLPNFLRSYGYQGQGNVGQYGERSFGRQGGIGPIQFTPEMYNWFTDSTLRNWLAWLFGERGFSPQTTFPG